MIKHKHDINYYIDGKKYKSINGIIELPKRIESLNPVDEDVKDWKAEAVTLGLEGEDLKKFMGKNKTQRQKQLDKLRG